MSESATQTPPSQLDKMKPRSHNKLKLSKPTERSIVAALSEGNISLQMGRYTSKKEIDMMRKKVITDDRGGLLRRLFNMARCRK